MNIVYLKRPTITNNRVNFSWASTSAINNCFFQDFYVEYPGIDLNESNISDHYNTALGILLSSFYKTDEEAIFMCEDEIPEWMASLWISYHSCDKVRIFPLEENSSKEIFRETKTTKKPHVGILFGGGKDSMFTLDLFRKILPNDKITLLSFTIPDLHVSLDELEIRRHKYALLPAMESYDVETCTVRTNVRGRFQNTLHIELYLACLLPVIRALEITDLTFSYEYCHYWAQSSSGREQLDFKRSMPEYTELVSRAYSRHLDIKLSIFNSNHCMTELSSFGYFVDSLKKKRTKIMMCESTGSTDKKWCCSCTKCAEFVLYSLFYGYDQKEININEFFKNSPYIKDVIFKIYNLEKMLGKNSNLNEMYFPKLTADFHYDSFRFVLSSFKGKVFDSLEADANKNLAKLIEVYGKDANREDVVYLDVLDKTWPAHYRETAKALVSAVVFSQDKAPVEKRWGNEIVKYNNDFKRNLGILEAPSTDAVVFSRYLIDANTVPPVSNSYQRANCTNGWNVIPLGGFTKNKINIQFYGDWISVSTSVSDPKRGDGFIISFIVDPPINKNLEELQLKIHSPYQNAGFEGRIGFQVEIENAKVYSQDVCSISGLVTISNDGLILDKEISILIRVEALKDCEDWNWGGAMRMLVETPNWCVRSCNVSHNHNEIIGALETDQVSLS